MWQRHFLCTGLLSVVMLALLAGCGGVPVEQTLSPTETRVQRVFKEHKQQGLLCDVVRTGLRSPYWADYEPPEGYTELSFLWPVGYDHFWHGWAHRPRCSHGNSETFTAAVRFDLGSLPPMVVSSAELKFTIMDSNRYPLSSEDRYKRVEYCNEASGDDAAKLTNAVVKNVHMVADSWDAGRHDVDSHNNLLSPTTTTGALSPRYFQEIDPHYPDKRVDVTDWVKLWLGQLRPAHANHGISFWGLNYDLRKKNRVCTAGIASIELVISGIRTDE